MTGMSPAKLLFGREIKTRLGCLKPQLSVIRKPESGDEPKRSVNVGDRVEMRNYTNKRKWIPGIVRRKIGSSMYEIEGDNKRVIRHIDQILKRSSREKQNIDDWQDTIDSEVAQDTRSRRYPERVRRPVDRYGL